jgi:hypothetical protein
LYLGCGDWNRKRAVDIAKARPLVRMRIYSSSILGSDISEVRGDMTVKLLERNDKSNLKVPEFKTGKNIASGGE